MIGLIASCTGRESKMKSGFDFDGVMRKLPYPFKEYMKRISANDAISRAGFSWIKSIVNSIIERMPSVMDPEVFEIMTTIGKEGDVYIVSGRREPSCRKIHDFLKRYNIDVQGVRCRSNLIVSEAEFKLDCCKKLNLNVFYEDRPAVASVLAEGSMRVVLWGGP